MSNNCLIDLSEMTLDEYLSLEKYINETMVITEASEEKAVNELLNKLKKVESDLNNKNINEDTIEEMKDIMKDLDTTASKVKKSKINTYATVAVVTEIIIIVEKIHSIINFCESLGLLEDDNIDEEKAKKLKFIVRIKTAFSKENIKKAIKDIFSLKNIAFTALSYLIEFTNIKSKEYYLYEKNSDKAYEMILKLEAKMMMEKRKAKKNGDKESESICNRVIEVAETIKAERVKQKALANKQVQNESALLEFTYNGNEEKINTFKLVCRDISNAMDINISNLRQCCSSALYCIRRSLELTESNKDKKFESMKDNIKKCNDFIEDVNRQYDERTINTLLQKYSSMFSNKYSNFGMKAREKFESKLADYADEINRVMKEFKIELSSIVSDNSEQSKSISYEVLNKKLSNKKLEESTLNKVKSVLNEVEDNSKKTLDNCKYYIKWCKDIVDSNKIKSSLSYVVFNKLFG